jgi:hypothetical protein
MTRDVIMEQVFEPAADESIAEQLNRWIGEHPTAQLLRVVVTYRETDALSVKQQQLARFRRELDALC